MRKRRILSLLLAVAVMATMLVAVPLTASAAVTLGDEVTTFSDSQVFKFTSADAGTLAKTNDYVVLDNKLVYYPGSDKNTENVCKIETTEQPGYDYAFNGCNGDNGKSVLVFKVSKPGTITVKLSYNKDVSNDTTKALKLATQKEIYFPNGYQKDTITSLSEDVTVSGDSTIVYVSCRQSSGISIYEIDYTVSATADKTLINIPEEITVHPGSVGTIVAQPQNFTEGTDVNNISWSIEESTPEGVSINQTGAYGLISVDRNVETKNLTVKATLNDSAKGDITQNCTVKIEAGTSTGNSWKPTGGSVTPNTYLIYNNDVSIVSMFDGGTVTNEEKYLEYDETYSPLLNVRDAAHKAPLITQDTDKGHNATVIAVKTTNAGKLTLKYRRTPDSNEYKNNEGKDIKVYDQALQNVVADTFLASSTTYQSGSNHYRFVTEIFDVDADQLYYIGASGATLAVGEISFDPNSGYGKSDTDSGIYYIGNDKVGGTKYGIIRFLQQYTGENVTEYGYYFVDQYGAIVKNVKMSGTETTVTEKGGFSGDLTGIPNKNLEDQFYAVPYVCIDNGKPIFGAVIGPVTVNQNNWISESEATATTE